MAHPPGIYSAILGSIANPLQPEGQWLPWVDGQEATLTEGAQGGFHIWMKLRIGGAGPGRELEMQKMAHRVSDDRLVLRAMQTIQVGPEGAEGFWEMPVATPMFMCPSPIGISVIDEAILFELIFTDATNVEVARAGIKVVPRCPTTSADSLMFCKRICTG